MQNKRVIRNQLAVVSVLCCSNDEVFRELSTQQICEVLWVLMAASDYASKDGHTGELVALLFLQLHGCCNAGNWQSLPPAHPVVESKKDVVLFC